MVQIVKRLKPDVVVLEVGQLTDGAGRTLTEEHIFQTMITQNAGVGGLDEVVEIRHRLLVAQHVSKVVGGYWPCVCVGVDGVDISGSEKESLTVLPVL